MFQSVPIPKIIDSPRLSTPAGNELRQRVLNIQNPSFHTPASNLSVVGHGAVPSPSLNLLQRGNRLSATPGNTS